MEIKTAVVGTGVPATATSSECFYYVENWNLLLNKFIFQFIYLIEFLTSSSAPRPYDWLFDSD